jgi:methyl halide transferase
VTDWNERYKVGDTPWEKGAAAPPLLSWIARYGPPTGEILVPGCGLGHDVRAIARASEDARVIGLDLAPEALARAKQYPQSGKESYICGDLFRLPPELTGRFDWVFEHTCFCAILPEQRADYVGALTTALRGSGQILGIFYLNPWDPGEAPPEGGPPFGVSLEELNHLFLPQFQLLQEEQPTTSYAGREGREILRLFRKR